MSIHPFDTHSTDVEQELARELQAIARQIRQALQNHKQRVARAENQESVNADTQIPASPYARLWEESWWETATNRDLAGWATAADHEAPYRADAAAAYRYLDDKLRNEYGFTLADYLAYLKEHGWEERYEQHQAVAAAKARGPQQQAKPARTVQRQVHQQHELAH